jgi:hypothetical protein
MNATAVADPRAAVRRRRFWTRLVLLGLVLIAGLVLVYGYIARIADRRLRDAMAEADRLDPGWRLEELEAAREAVPDAENAAPRVLATYRLLPPQNQWPDYHLDQALGQLAPTEPPAGEQLATLRATLAQAQAVVEAGRQLADYRRGRHAIIWGPDLLMTPLPHVDAIGSLIRFLTFDLFVRLEDGDVAGALRTCQAQLQTARSLGDEPYAVTQMVRLWHAAEALAHVERCLAHGQTDGATLEALQRLAEDEASQPFALRTARGARALLHGGLRQLEDGTVKMDAMRGWFSDPEHRDVSPYELWSLRLPGALKSNHAATLQHLNQLVEIARLPLEEQDRALQALASNSGKQALFVRMLQPFPDGQRQAIQRRVGRLRAAVAMLAVERFRLARQRWPESLEELRPGYLSAVPIDPFDGKPLRYRRLADGVVIYVIGPDARDDGGNLSRADEPPDGTDIGFRLWDAAARRRPTPEAKAAP